MSDGPGRRRMRKGPINKQPHGAKENRQTDILEASLPEGHRIIDFHEGTAEVDRIHGGKTAERQDRGGDGAQGRALQHDARTQGMAEWQECWAVRRESRLMRRESVADVQPVPR